MLNTSYRRFNKKRHRSILKIMGYSDPDSSPARIHNLINEFMSKAPLWINPSYHYVIKKVEVVSGRYALLEGGIRLESAVIAELLKRCDKAAFFALTFGSRLEKSRQIRANGASESRGVVAVGSVWWMYWPKTVQSVSLQSFDAGTGHQRRFSTVTATGTSINSLWYSSPWAKTTPVQT